MLAAVLRATAPPEELHEDEFTLRDYLDAARERGITVTPSSAARRLASLVSRGMLTQRRAIQYGRACLAYRPTPSLTSADDADILPS